MLEQRLEQSMTTSVFHQQLLHTCGDFLKLRANNKSGINGGVGIVHVDYASHIPGDTQGNYWCVGIFKFSNSWFNGNPTTDGGGGEIGHAVVF